MQVELHYNTVTPLLKEILLKLMVEPLFEPFRLVGGTNLSLRFGHRISVDIDLFTDAEYRSLDFRVFEQYLQKTFPLYYGSDSGSIVGMGRSYFIGKSEAEYVKLDLMYADPFIRKPEIIDGIRMASTDDIVAMKINVISRGGRKKDFWDIHYLLGQYTFEQMLELHAQRHEWEHDAESLIRKFRDFSIADEMPDPICLMGKDWDDIKIDLIEISDS